MEKCFEVIREAAAKSDSRIAALGISSQGEAFTALDSQGNYLCNAMVSSDSRAAGITDEWSEHFGLDRLYQITGHAPHPMFSLFKLLWLRENRKDVWDRVHKFMFFEDLLQYSLGVEVPSMAYSLAGRSLLFDVRKHCWSPEILKAAGLDEKNFSRPLPPGAIAGHVSSDIARSLNLSNGTLVVTGGHDQTCAALGTGAVAPGEAMYATGTVDCICPVIGAPVFSRALMENNLCMYDYSLPGVYTTVAYSLTGGNILKWFRDNFAEKEVNAASDSKSNAYELILKEMPSKPSELMVLPYFTPSGTPYFDVRTPGAILGLRLSTTRMEILKALLEGVAMEMRLNLEILQQSGIGISILRTTGGASQSRILNQMKADVINKPIQCMEITEGGCMGVALLAAAAFNETPVPELAGNWCKYKYVAEPDPARAESYGRKFEQYKKIYPAIRDIYIAQA
jgi:xylulokinase